MTGTCIVLGWSRPCATRTACAPAFRRSVRCSRSGDGAGSCGTRQSTNRSPGGAQLCVACRSCSLTRVAGSLGCVRVPRSQQQMLRPSSQSLTHSFNVKGRARPKLKARKRAFPSLDYTTRGFSIRDGRLRLPSGVSVPVVWSRDLPSEPSSVRVYQDSLGHWFASFVVRRDVEAAAEVEGSIG